MPERKGKNISKRVRHSGSAIKDAALKCCWGFVQDPGPVGKPREPPITTPLDSRGAVAPLCFAFKTSYPASALHTSPSSLARAGTSSRCLGNKPQEQGRSCQAPPYTHPPSRKLLFRVSSSPRLHLITMFESYSWRYL